MIIHGVTSHKWTDPTLLRETQLHSSYVRSVKWSDICSLLTIYHSQSSLVQKPEPAVFEQPYGQDCQGKEQDKDQQVGTVLSVAFFSFLLCHDVFHRAVFSSAQAQAEGARQNKQRQSSPNTHRGVHFTCRAHVAISFRCKGYKKMNALCSGSLNTGVLADTIIGCCKLFLIPSDIPPTARDVTWQLKMCSSRS